MFSFQCGVMIRLLDRALSGPMVSINYTLTSVLVWECASVDALY